MSTVLTIDLDFFVTPTATWRGGDKRLEDEGYQVWDEEKTINFLENNCILSKKYPLPGKVVIHHDEAFDIIKQLYSKKTLEFPVHLINVDAHSDLGLGDGGWRHILTDVIHRDLPERSDNLRQERKSMGLNEGNWIAYTMANRWIENLTLVKQTNTHHKDLFPYYFQERGKYEKMQMYPLSDDEAISIGGDDKQYKDFFESKKSSEPQISLFLKEADNFILEKSPDYLIFCHSPAFTPPKADPLLNIFKKYIKD